MFLFRSSLTLIICSGFFFLQAQKIPLIHSGDVIKRGIALYDSGRHEDAIALFMTVPERDSNYTYMLSEIALAYIAKKSYALAIEACTKVLKHPNPYRKSVYNSLGSALDYSGEFDSAVSTYEKGLTEFPFDASLHYNLGVAHYNHKNYVQARDYFFKTLMLNPYHAGSHLNLGRLAAFQGKKSRAMMSLGIYLSIRNTDNERLVFLEQLLNNEIIEEGSFPFEGSDGFDRLDQIIKAKVAFDKNFKPAIPINAAVVRQYQLFLQQLQLIDVTERDPWVDFYLPIYQEIAQKEMLEPFLYHLLSSINNAEVSKWKSRNSRMLDAYFSAVNDQLKSVQKGRSLPEDLGFPDPVTFWYSTSNVLEAIGNEDQAGKREGKWKFFSSNGVCTAEGSYDGQGEKTEIWRYYHTNGLLKSVENYGSGEFSLFNASGSLINEYKVRDGLVEGDVKVWFPCGQLKTSLVFAADKRNGPVHSFFENGNVSEEYTLKDDDIDGIYTSYYVNGVVKQRSAFNSGKRIGKFEEFYPDGTIKVRGAYLEGKADGQWEYFYGDGSLERKGSYIDDLANGNWTYYDGDAAVSRERYYRDGDIDGEESVYHQGRLHYVNAYRNGILVGVTYYNTSEEEVSKVGDPTGTFRVTGYYPDMKLRFEGGYEKGLSTGKWKYYYREGMLQKECIYRRDTLQGEMIEYFRDGEVKRKDFFKDGQRDGYSTSYFVNGQVEEEGWYQNDLRAQQWITRYEDHGIKWDTWYEAGEITGTETNVNSDGKPFSAFTYREGRLTHFSFFDEQGEVAWVGDAGQGSQKYKRTFTASERTHTEFSISCGNFNGLYREYFPDGSVMISVEYLNGVRDGKFEYFFANGNIEVKGRYIDGDRTGLWTFGEITGGIYCTGRYLFGEPDSTWTYYFQNGTIAKYFPYRFGERQGTAKFFNPDGILVAEKSYEDGDLIAFRVLKNGVMPADWEVFKENSKLSATLENGSVVFAEQYRHGLLDGKSSLFYKNGKLYEEKRYELGEFMGDHLIYYPNGQLKEKIGYRYDHMDGDHEVFTPTGELLLKERYRLGLKNGPSVLRQKNKPNVEISFFGGDILD